MARCIQCGKRANRQHRCFWCGRGPKCLRCVCPCRQWENVEAVVQRLGPILGAPDNLLKEKHRG